MNTTLSPLPEQNPVPLSTPPQHPWEKYLPSRRIRLVILVLVIGLIGYGLWKPVSRIVKSFFSKDVSVMDSLLPTPVTEQPVTQLSIDKDTDGDGLADWQETLIGTDPEIPNSESEIPKELREIITEKAAAVVTPEDKLALSIYQRLLSEPVGDDINQAIQAATTKEMLDLANSLEKKAPLYSYDDLILVEVTPETKNSYKKQITVLQKNLEIPAETFQSIYNYLLHGEKTITETTFQVSLGQRVTKMLEVEVPLIFAEQHLNGLNALSRINSLLSISENSESLRYASLLAFQKNVNRISESMQNINSLLTVSP